MSGVQRNYYARDDGSSDIRPYEEHGTSRTERLACVINPSDEDVSTAVVSSPVTSDSNTNSTQKDIKVLKLYVTESITNVQNNKVGSSNVNKMIDVCLRHTPVLLSKFHKYNWFGKAILSLTQISDLLMSFLKEDGDDINGIAEVFGLLVEIQAKLPNDMASSVINYIFNDRHVNICVDILSKWMIATVTISHDHDHLFKVYHCVANVLLLQNKLRCHLLFNSFFFFF